MGETERFLGYVAEIVPAGARPRHAQLRPQFRSWENGSSWEPVQGLQWQFPNRGFVTWFEPPQEACIRSLWEFEVTEQASFSRDNPKHDQFTVGGVPTQTWAILDLREQTASQIRRRLATEGVKLDYAIGEHVYIWGKENKCYGPVNLVADPEHPRQRRLVLPDDPVSVWHPPVSGTYAELPVQPPILCLAPMADLSSYVGSVDWSADDKFLANILRELQLAGEQYPEAASKLAEVLAQYSTLSPLDVDPHLRDQRARRAINLVKQIEHRGELLSAVIPELLRHPSAQAAIDAQAEEARRSALEGARGELEDLQAQASRLRAEVSRARQELAQLEREVAQAQSRRDETLSALARDVERERTERSSGLERQIADKRAELDRLTEELRQWREELVDQAQILDEKLTERLNEIVSRPERSLAEILIYRAALGSHARPGSPDDASAHACSAIRPIPLRTFPWPAAGGERGGAIGDPKTLRLKLVQAFVQRQLPPAAARQLHAALLASAMPILVGSGAYEVIGAYASCVTGSRLLWIPVSPTAVEPDDLLARWDSETHRLMPAANGLVDLLLSARDSDELYLVVLDGVNRSNVDAYLSPILTSYQGSILGDCGRSIPLAHSEAIASDDPRAAAAYLQWPNNVLLAGTLAEGVVSLPLPRSLWASACLINLEALYSGDDGHHSEELPAAGRGNGKAPAGVWTVSTQTWREWRKLVLAAGPLEGDDLIQAAVDRGIELRRGERNLARRFLAAVGRWGVDPGQAQLDMLACCLAAQAPAQHEKLDEMISERQLGDERSQNRTRCALRLAREALLHGRV